MGMVIVERFPKPPALVAHALTQLQIASGDDLDAIAGLGDINTLPRPWEPASCGDQLRQHIWQWCDKVAAWINSQYVWRGTHLIPACWPSHPHIANELPALACQRALAAHSTSPEPLEEWQRNTLPQFLERLATRLGESTCRVGKHVDWPAAARHQSSQTDSAVGGRQDMFYVDTHPPRQLRPASGGGTERDDH
jgi:hypothetical protein